MSFEQLKTLLEEHKSAVDALKEADSERAEEMKRLGSTTGITEQKMAEINTKLDSVEEQITQLETAMQRKAKEVIFQDQKTAYSALVLEHKEAFGQFLKKGQEHGLRELEVKAMSTLSDPDGGYMVAVPMSDRIVQYVYETTPMRELAGQVSISTRAYPGMYDNDEADAGWAGETESRTETKTPQLGQFEIPVHEIYAKPKITQTLLDDTVFDVESWLARKVGSKFSRKQNTAFILGDGIKQPRGVLTYPAGSGHKQIEQIVSGNATALTGDGIIALTGSLKEAYLANATFLMNRATLTQLRTLKDGQGNYLWQPNYQLGLAQTLVGYPIRTGEDMPTVAAGALPIAFGDFREAYLIVDRQGVRVLRDPYSSKPFVEFYHTARVGGDVVNFEAIKLQKIST
jgi:HK97 family phage major capsid protein